MMMLLHDILIIIIYIYIYIYIYIIIYYIIYYCSSHLALPGTLDCDRRDAEVGRCLPLLGVVQERGSCVWEAAGGEVTTMQLEGGREGVGRSQHSSINADGRWPRGTCERLFLLEHASNDNGPTVHPGAN